jgi:lactoylglutathione lyase
MAGIMTKADDRHAAPESRADEAATPMSVRIAHVALWTDTVERLEQLRAFYERHFGAQPGALYASARQPGFVSYFLTFASGAQIELMTLPTDAAAPRRACGVSPGEPRCGYAHVALTLGSTAAVDAMTARLAADGVQVVSMPRWTGDGCYESVIADPDGNLVELTA